MMDGVQQGNAFSYYVLHLILAQDKTFLTLCASPPKEKKRKEKKRIKV